MHLNMKKIASLAGVSVATVSRVFRDPSKVSAATRELVLETARANGYTYNAAAGDISSCQSRVVGVLVPTADNAPFAASVNGIQDELAPRGFSTIQASTKYDFNEEQILLERFIERRVAGIIMTGFNFGQEKYLQKIVEKSGIPVVIMWEKAVHKFLHYVGIDNYSAAYKAVQYLISLGHRRIGLIIGPIDQTERVKKRYLGYQDALRDAGIPVEKHLIVMRSPIYLEGNSAMNVLFELPDPPTAVFAASDLLAIGAMNAIQQRGLRVPEDISVMGFDNAPVSAFMNPPLSTVGVDSYTIGKLAAQCILEQKAREAKHYCLGTELLIRESCARYLHNAEHDASRKEEPPPIA